MKKGKKNHLYETCIAKLKWRFNDLQQQLHSVKKINPTKEVWFFHSSKTRTGERNTEDKKKKTTQKQQVTILCNTTPFSLT